MAENTNFIVTELDDYIATNRELLISSFGLIGPGTRERVTILTGVKYKEKLNYLEIEPELQSGEDCGFNAQEGGLELTDREVEVAPIKVDIEVCPRTLRKKYAQYLIRINAIEEGQRMPFAQEVTTGLVGQINKKIEFLIWQGDTTSLSTDLKWINGWLKLITVTDAASTIQVANMPAGAYEGILAVYMAMTAEALKRGGEIYVAPEIYRVFLQDMVVKNYYHYAGPDNAAPGEFILPGTNVKVVSTEGLTGKLTIVGTWPENLVYATDMEGDEEDLDLWYSKDDRIYKMEALWNSGVNYYFPSHITYGTFAAAPGIGAGVGESLASIATSAATLAGAVNEDGQVETHPNS